MGAPRPPLAHPECVPGTHTPPYDSGPLMPPGGNCADGRVIVVQRQAELLHVVDALRSAGGFTSRLDRRQQQRDQDGDDGDDHQQFDQGETQTRTAASPDGRRKHQTPLGKKIDKETRKHLDSASCEAETLAGWSEELRTKINDS